MLRLYLAVPVASLALAILTVPSTATGQTASLPEQPLLGSTLNGDAMRDLPTTDNPFAVLETIQPETIGSRVSSGGLNIPAPQFGAFLNSWTQTQYRIGDIAISDPRAGGTPLLLPLLPFWERITTETGAMGVDQNAPALSMTLEPPRPGTRWVRTIEGSLSGPALVAEGNGPVPVVDRVRQWQDGSVLVSGPVTDRLGLVAAGSWRGLSHVAAPSASATSDQRDVRTGASRLCGEPAGRGPRARLGPAGHDGRIHGYCGARSVHLGAARPCAAGVARVRRVHRTQPHRASDVQPCRGHAHQRSGVGSDRRRRRHRRTLGARSARGSPGDAAASHLRSRSRRRSGARRADGDRADRRAGQRDASPCLDVPCRRRHGRSTSDDAGGLWKRARDRPASDPRRGRAARHRDRRG